ncbi:hypothetical protein ACHAQA_009026 [Verticillium albo-atrum]
MSSLDSSIGGGGYGGGGGNNNKKRSGDIWGGGRRNGPICYKCGREGHIQSKCPQLEGEELRRAVRSMLENVGFDTLEELAVAFVRTEEARLAEELERAEAHAEMLRGRLAAKRAEREEMEEKYGASGSAEPKVKKEEKEE